MYDTNKVLLGVLVFLGLMTSPFWLNAGKFKPMPKLQMPKFEKKCVETADFMKANHMKLLDNWRFEAVRLDEWQYTSHAYGKTYRKSLVGTCIHCHETKKKFCDRCHTYAGVKPYCWSCHVAPQEPEEKS